MADLHAAGCDLLTITQYLRPTPRHHPVERWVKPEEFVELREEALQMGFAGVMSGPLVRSSYRAGRLYRQAAERRAATAVLVREATPGVRPPFRYGDRSQLYRDAEGTRRLMGCRCMAWWRRGRRGCGRMWVLARTGVGAAEPCWVCCDAGGAPAGAPVLMGSVISGYP